MRLYITDEPSSSYEKCKARFDILEPFMVKGGVGAEIGVFKGAFVEWLLKSNPSKLYLVDPWFRFSSVWEWAKGDKSTVKAFLEIVREYTPEIERKIVEPRVEYSQDFLQLIPDSHLDWVYIDSTHGYGQTKIEIEYCLRKVKKDGYIMGDDYTSDPAHPHYGVCKAVQEFVADGKLKLVVDGIRRQFVASLI